MYLMGGTQDCFLIQCNKLFCTEQQWSCWGGAGGGEY